MRLQGRRRSLAGGSFLFVNNAVSSFAEKLSDHRAPLSAFPLPPAPRAA
jgi:hypothetical protein